MSNANPESFVNFILDKEKTPSPSTRLIKEVSFSILFIQFVPSLY